MSPRMLPGRGEVGSALCVVAGQQPGGDREGRLSALCWEMRCHFRNYTQLFVINRRVPAGWAGWGWGIETKPRSKFNPFWVSGQSQKSPETSLATARKVGQDFLSGKRLPIPSLPTCKTSHFKHLKKAPRMGCSGTTVPRNGRVACISGRPQPSPARVHPRGPPLLPAPAQQLHQVGSGEEPPFLTHRRVPRTKRQPEGPCGGTGTESAPGPSEVTPSGGEVGGPAAPQLIGASQVCSLGVRQPAQEAG